MLTYSNILIQVMSIIVIAYILRYAKVFKWKQSWVIAFGVISITYLIFKTSNTMNTQFTTLEWFVISFINTIGAPGIHLYIMNRASIAKKKEG